jgi:hypothetical protein
MEAPALEDQDRKNDERFWERVHQVLDALERLMMIVLLGVFIWGLVTGKAWAIAGPLVVEIIRRLVHNFGGRDDGK